VIGDRVLAGLGADQAREVAVVEVVLVRRVAVRRERLLGLTGLEEAESPGIRELL
jgi:hypothetical protein